MGADSSSSKQFQLGSNLAMSERGENQQITNESKKYGKPQNRSKSKRIDEFPYNCIGMLGWKNLSTNSIYFGTAFLVAPNLILTALHNAADSFGFMNHEMKFFPKLNEDYHDATFIEIKDSRYNKQACKQKDIETKYEYCLLLLKKQIRRDQYIALGYNYNLINNPNVQIYGYPFDLINQKQITFQFGCKGKIIQIQEQSLYYQHNTGKGQSGAPIIVTTSDNHKIAVGIHCKANNLKQINFGCRFTKIIADTVLRWAYELTANQQSIQVIDVSKATFNENPIQKYKKQQYSFITIIPQIKTIAQQNKQNELKSKKIQSKIVLDLWQTIIDGSFNINRYPFDCIGLIIGTYMDHKTHSTRKHYGTGFLINSNIVLTSIYNLIKFQENYIIQYQNLVFYPKLHGELDNELNQNQARKIIFTKYNIPKIRPSSQKDIVQTSLAMLIIDKKVDRHRYILIGQNFQEKNEVYLFGYGWNELNRSSTQDYTKFNQRGSQGKIIEATDQIIYHNAYSQNGSEGSPLLVEYIRGFFFIVGIHIRNKYQEDQPKCLALKMTTKRVGMLNQWLKEIPKKQKIFSYNLKDNTTWLQWKQQSYIFPKQKIFFLQNQLRSNEGRSYSKSDILINLAQLNSKIGKYTKSNDCLARQHQLKKGQSFFQLNEVNQIYYFNHMGSNNIQLKEKESAEIQFNRAWMTMKRLVQQLHFIIDPIILIALCNNFGILQAKNGDMKSAEAYFSKALSSIPQDGKYNIYKCLLTNNISLLYLKSKKNSQNIFQQELDRIFNSVRKINSSQQLLILAKIGYNLSIHYFSTYNYKKGIQYLETYLDTMNKLGLTCHTEYIQNIKCFEDNIEQLLQMQIQRDVILRIIKIIRKHIDPENHNYNILDQLKVKILPEGLF